MSARSHSEREDQDLILSPSSTLCSTSPALHSFDKCTIPRLEMDPIDTSPFLDSFSGLIEDELVLEVQELPGAANADISYDIERFTDVKKLDPEWEDEDVDEILVLSAKTPRKLSTIEEEPTSMGNTEVISLLDFEPLLGRNEGYSHGQQYRKRDTGRIYAFRTFQDSVMPPPEQAALIMIKDSKAPFLPQVHWTFQEASRFVAVMDNHFRKTLGDVVAFQGALQPYCAHFYASELVQALSALHAVGIVHRDLRPENITVDFAGHVVVDGFGASDILRQPGEAQDPGAAFCTSQVGGNSTFRAPELVLGWAHDFGVDSWGFGMLLRFMLSGMHLFSDNNTSQPSWKDIIVHDSIALCPLLESSAQDLISKCLERNPIARLSISGIKMHSYFAATDWNKVAAKRIQVPPVASNKESDPRHFAFHINKIGSTTPDTGGHHSREPSSLAISASASDSTSANVSTAPTSCEQLRALPRIFRMSSLLDDLPDTAESMPPLDPTVHSALTLSDSPANLSERDIDPQDRMALFWDRLDSEEVSISPAPSLDSTNPAPRPRKLRKSRSSIYPEQRFSTLSASSLQNKLRKKSRPTNAPPLPENAQQPAAELNLPDGLIRIGGGIGFKYNIPAASGSRASICSNTPQTCHAAFQRRLPNLGLGLRLRSTSALAKAKARRTLLSLAIPGTPEEQDMATFPKDFRGSSWSLVTPLSPEVLNIESGSAEAASSSPVSEAGPLTPTTLVCEELGVVVIEEERFEERVAQEVKAGDAEVTLRLVVPSGRVEVE